MTALDSFPARKRRWRHGIVAELSRNYFLPCIIQFRLQGDPGPYSAPRFIDGKTSEQPIVAIKRFAFFVCTECAYPNKKRKHVTDFSELSSGRPQRAREAVARRGLAKLSSAEG